MGVKYGEGVYDCYEWCPICPGAEGENEIRVTCSEGGAVWECETECKKCKLKNYWAYGNFAHGDEE